MCSCRSVSLVNLVISLNVIHSFYLLALPICDIIEHNTYFYLLALPICDIIEHKGSYMSVGLVH